MKYIKVFLFDWIYWQSYLIGFIDKIHIFNKLEFSNNLDTMLNTIELNNNKNNNK